MAYTRGCGGTTVWWLTQWYVQAKAALEALSKDAKSHANEGKEMIEVWPGVDSEVADKRCVRRTSGIRMFVFELRILGLGG